MEDLPRACAAGGADRGHRHSWRAADRLRHQSRLHRPRDHAWRAGDAMVDQPLDRDRVRRSASPPILTLIVTPAALMGIANIAARRDRWRERRLARRAGGACRRNRALRLRARQQFVGDLAVHDVFEFLKRTRGQHAVVNAMIPVQQNFHRVVGPHQTIGHHARAG